jgi:hypothetical protein
MAIFSIFLSSIQIIAMERSNAATAAGTQCLIGFSQACPASSPQEIYNLYGTTQDGVYWINIEGTSTQSYLKMNRTNTDNGSWVLMMKGTKSTSFNYSSDFFDSSTYVLNENSLADDVITNAKFSSYNKLAITKILAVFKDYNGGNYSAGGDITSSGFNGLTWLETISSTTAFNRLNGSATNLINRNSLKSQSNLSLQFGWTNYGFNISCTGLTARWALLTNQEVDDKSCDRFLGIGVGVYGTGNVSNGWDHSSNANYFASSISNPLGASGFQIWGKIANPTLGAVTNLSATQGGNSAALSWTSVSGANEYAITYKKSSDSWNNLTSFSQTSNSNSASISGLASGETYEFRVTARNGNNSSTTYATTSVTTIGNVSSLTGIALSSGSLSPSFNAGQLSYSVAVDSTTSSINVTPSFSGVGETVTVNSTLTSSGSPKSVALNIGINTVTIIGYAQDGSRTTYTLSVTKAKSDQSALTFSGSTLTYGDSVTLTASGGTSSNPITFAVASGNCSITDAKLSASSAGSCTVTASKLGDATYADISKTVTFIFNSKTLTISAESKSIISGAATPTFTYLISGFIGSDSATISSITKTFNGSASVPTTAGTYTIAPSSASLTFSTGSSSNYSYSYQNGTYQITDAPIVSDVTATNSNGSLKVGDTLTIQVTFTETVTVSGVPKIALETGAMDRDVSYVSGSGSKILVFTYTVQSGDSASDLDYLSTSALGISPGTIISAATGINAVLTLPAPGSSGSLSANKNFVIDTTAPAQLSAVDLFTASDSGRSNSDNITNDSTPTISVSGVEAGATAIVTASKTGTTSVNCTVSAGSCSLGSLADGVWSITVIQTDAAGNTSTASTSLSITVDTIAPSAPSSLDMANNSDLGTSNTDNKTYLVNSIEFTGSAESGSVVQLYVGGVSNGSTCTSSSGIFTCQSGSVSEGSLTLTANATDAAGNTSLDSNSLLFTVDSTAPTASITSSTIGVGGANNFAVTSGEIGIAYLVKSSVSVTNIASITNAASSQKSSIQITAINTNANILVSGLEDGAYKLYLLDSAGNLSDGSTGLLTLDRLAPTAAVATAVILNSENATVQGTKTGTAYLVSSTVAVSTLSDITSANGNLWNSVSISSANSDTNLSAAGLVNGTYKVYLVDNSNNLSDPSANSLVIASAPGAPSNITGVAGDGSIALSWSAPSNGGSAITDYQIQSTQDDPSDPSAIWTTFNDGTSSSTSTTVTGLTNGQTYSFKIKAANAATNGNFSGASAGYAPADAGPPSVISRVLSSNGTTLTMTFSEPIAANTAALSTYTVTARGVSVPLSSRSVSGSTIVLTLTNSIDSGRTVTISYTDPTSGNDTYAIQDTSLNDLPSFSSASVINNSTIVTAPGTPSIPTVVAGNSQVTVTVNEPTTGGVVDLYTIKALDSSGVAISPAKECTIAISTGGSCIVTGLNNETNYKFLVEAYNASGTSSSGNSSAVTPVAPAVPTTTPSPSPQMPSTPAPGTNNSNTPTQKSVTDAQNRAQESAKNVEVVTEKVAIDKQEAENASEKANLDADSAAKLAAQATEEANQKLIAAKVASEIAVNAKTLEAKIEAIKQVAINAAQVADAAANKAAAELAQAQAKADKDAAALKIASSNTEQFKAIAAAASAEAKAAAENYALLSAQLPPTSSTVMEAKSVAEVAAEKSQLATSNVIKSLAEVYAATVAVNNSQNIVQNAAAIATTKSTQAQLTAIKAATAAFEAGAAKSNVVVSAAKAAQAVRNAQIAVNKAGTDRNQANLAFNKANTARAIAENAALNAANAKEKSILLALAAKSDPTLITQAEIAKVEEQKATSLAQSSEKAAITAEKNASKADLIADRTSAQASKIAIQAQEATARALQSVTLASNSPTLNSPVVSKSKSSVVIEAKIKTPKNTNSSPTAITPESSKNAKIGISNLKPGQRVKVTITGVGK